ncbi:MAG: hypothetical protein WCA20_36410, partial [Candidatus Sulfotelmatobacter sp.]
KWTLTLLRIDCSATRFWTRRAADPTVGGDVFQLTEGGKLGLGDQSPLLGSASAQAYYGDSDRSRRRKSWPQLAGMLSRIFRIVQIH